MTSKMILAVTILLSLSIVVGGVLYLKHKEDDSSFKKFVFLGEMEVEIGEKVLSYQIFENENDEYFMVVPVGQFIHVNGASCYRARRVAKAFLNSQILKMAGKNYGQIYNGAQVEDIYAWANLNQVKVNGKKFRLPQEF